MGEGIGRIPATTENKVVADGGSRRQRNSVVMLAGDGISTRIIYNALKERVPISTVVLEAPVSRLELLCRRRRRFGLPKVAGQVLFQLVIARLLRVAARGRIRDILQEAGIREIPMEPTAVHRVRSINSKNVIDLLRQLGPKVVLVNGTRIISDDVLSCVDAVFINVHVGITPCYRGVHGAYWALVERNYQGCGVTVHVVDSGIDTGSIIEQALIRPTARDNFATYPVLQTVTALPLVERAVNAALAGELRFRKTSDGKSQLWTHPTAGEYIWNRFRLGVK